MIEISPVQSRVLSGSGGSSLGLVGVGIPADAATAATVGGVVERTGSAESFAERADSPTNRATAKSPVFTYTQSENLSSETENPTFGKTQDPTSKTQDLTHEQ